MTEIKQPKIRFKGHINDWEQRKLSEILKLFGGNAFSSKSSTDKGIPWLKIANVDMNGIDWSTESFLPEEYWEKYPNYRLFPDDYVMALTRPILNHKLKIGKVDKESLLNQRVAKLQFELNKEFTFQLIQIRSVIAKVENELAGTDPPNLSVKNLNNISVMINKNLEEQKKIGKFFKTLDDTIALHEKKLEVTKQFKRTMLKKMFPKNGETTPEIRFKGFTEDWEECKLKDLCNISSGYNWKSKDYTVDGRFKVITIANVTGDYFINTDIGNNIDISNIDNKYVLKENDILITMTGNIGRVSKVPNGDYLLNQRVCKVSSNSIDNEFLYTILSDIQFENYCVLQGQGLAQANISNKDILNYKISVPNIKEQIIISDFFKNIDLNILHLKNKIEQNKRFKSSMLKNLFI